MKSQFEQGLNSSEWDALHRLKFFPLILEYTVSQKKVSIKNINSHLLVNLIGNALISLYPVDLLVSFSYFYLSEKDLNSVRSSFHQFQSAKYWVIILLK